MNVFNNDTEEEAIELCGTTDEDLFGVTEEGEIADGLYESTEGEAIVCNLRNEIELDIIDDEFSDELEECDNV